MSTTTPIPQQDCKRCGFTFLFSTSMAHERTPYPGCVSICVKCGLVQVFDDKLMLRYPTAEESAQIEADPTITQLQILRAGAPDFTKNRPRNFKPPRYWK